jgi:hypothetical protein
VAALRALDLSMGLASSARGEPLLLVAAWPSSRCCCSDRRYVPFSLGKLENAIDDALPLVWRHFLWMLRSRRRAPAFLSSDLPQTLRQFVCLHAAFAFLVCCPRGRARRCRDVSGLESGEISGCAGADGRPSGVLPMKIVSQCREQARRVYYGAVFEIKKEIPAED